MLIKDFKYYLDKHDIQYHENYSLAKFSSFRIGGNAKIFISINNLNSLKLIQKELINSPLPYFFIGGGSNLLISDNGYSGVVLQLNFSTHLKYTHLDEQQSIINISANTRSAWFAKKVSAESYEGLEFLSTIPGQIGGAIIQNAGCYGSEICEFTHVISALDNGIVKNFTTQDAHFTYRNSIFKQNKSLWVFEVNFLLKKGNENSIQEKILKYQQHRLQSQPKNRRSAGSIFKNPNPQTKAWELIQKVGLQGKKIGDACFSSDHANFIVNLGNAKAHDVYSLILLAQEKVKQKEKIDLEREVIFVGDF